MKILPAQRYSMIIDAGNNSQDWWLCGKINLTCFAEKNPDLQDQTRSIVRIRHVKQIDRDRGPLPSIMDWDEATDVVCRDVNTSFLTPAKVIAAPAKANCIFHFRFSFEIGSRGLSCGFFNHSPFRPNLRSLSFCAA